MKERIRIVPDPDPSNPREESDGWLGQMVCWHRRYVLGDVQETQDPEDWLSSLPAKHVKLPLFLYDHSGLAMNTTGFHCQWDSCQVGWIYTTPAMAKACGLDWDEDQLAKYLADEVATYSSYLEGDVYGFIHERQCEACGAWEEIDSCWGFIGRESVEAELPKGVMVV